MRAEKRRAQEGRPPKRRALCTMGSAVWVGVWLELGRGREREREEAALTLRAARPHTVGYTRSHARMSM